MSAAGGPQATVRLRIGTLEVRCRGDADVLERAMGPLRALAIDGEELPTLPAGASAVQVEVHGSAAVPRAHGEAGRAAQPTRYETDGGEPVIVAPGLGEAVLRTSGVVEVRLLPDAPEGDALAERLTIPALAERLRREGVRLVHGAILRAPHGRSALLVPAARGGGKTTLSLSLARHGFTVLSDDRGWLGGPADAAWIDAWPEAPRVGDRSLFLLPSGLASGPRDARTGKAVVPGLTPPRLASPLAVGAVALPRLVEGPGGAWRTVHGAAALAPLLSQCVVATDPRSAADTMRFVAALLAARPAFEVEVGDDPASLAAASADLTARTRPGAESARERAEAGRLALEHVGEELVVDGAHGAKSVRGGRFTDELGQPRRVEAAQRR